MDRDLAPEMWVASRAPRERTWNCHNSSVNHYEHEYPRFLYAGDQCDVDLDSHCGHTAACKAAEAGARV